MYISLLEAFILGYFIWYRAVNIPRPIAVFDIKSKV
jgi:hypothetical protein